MMRSSPTVLVALIVVLAGCLGGPASPSGTPSDDDASDDGSSTKTPDGNDDGDGTGNDTPTTEGNGSQDAIPPTPPLVHHGCTVAFTGYLVQASAVEPYLPDGFNTTGPPRVLGIPVDAGPDTATVTVFAGTCQNATHEDVVVDGSRFLGTTVFVDPPDRFENTSVGSYQVPIDMTLASEDEASVYRSFGFPSVAAGTVQVDTVEQEQASQVRADATIGGGRVTVTSTAWAPIDLDGGTVRYFAVDGDNVTGAVDIDIAPSTALPTGRATTVLQGDDVPLAPRVTNGWTLHYMWPSDQWSYRWRPVDLNATETS